MTTDELRFSHEKKHKRRRFAVILAIVIMAGLLWTTVTAARIVDYADEESARHSDAAIILGAAVAGDQPSPVFRARIEHAIMLYKQGTVGNLIFTGSSAGPGLPTEAEVGRDYALAQGVDPARIRIETESTITEENLIYALAVGEAAGFQTYTIVSDPLHMRRSMKLAHQLGMDAAASPTRTSAYETWKTKLPFLARETVLTMGYTVKGWISPSR